MLLATLAVVAQPVITVQPTNQSVLGGTTATFSVTVSGTGPFTYQWQFNGNNLPPIITTFAGNGTASFSGDGGPAINASLFEPEGMTVDAVGNLFIADDGNDRIRKVDTNGTITTVAGNGNLSFSGDGGFATNAALCYPEGVAVDDGGSLFIADYYNNRIRKVGANGIISTVAGNGAYSFYGDGGAATNASLGHPIGVAVERKGNLFIVDSYNNRVRKVATNGIITTVAGNGSVSFSGDGGVATNAALNNPAGLAVDASGNLFVADSNNNRIRKITTNGIITTVAGNGISSFSGDDGIATNASLANPLFVAVDGKGNLFIADFYNNRVRKVDTNGFITTAAGSSTQGFSGDGGAATNAALDRITGVAVDSTGNLFIGGFNNARIRKVQINSRTLVLNNVSPNNAGNYSVVVTGVGGSVTSSIAVLTFILPTPTAIGLAMLTNGFVVGVNIIDGGSGYTNTPLVRLIGGGGSGAQAFAVVSNGVVTGIIVTNAGIGYTNAPVVVIEPPFIPNPVLGIAPMSFLAFSNLTVGGSYQLQRAVAWYWTNQPVSFTATDVIYTQMVAGVAGGGDYRLALNPAPTQAFATPEVVNGFVVGATVTSGGSGYVTSPAVKIVGGGGTNATAVAQISGGVVTSISMTSAGFGYTNTPTVRIAQPPAAAVSPAVLPVMRVDSASLAPLHNYQIQFKPDIFGTWVDWNGGLFSPTDVTNSQFLFITNGLGFFRLQFVP
jgi:sugar lactone lactonase YvrE